MSFYQERVLPYLVHLSMRQATFEPYRQRVVTEASGRRAEIGVGSGLNLPLYQAATHVIALDPSTTLLAMARSTGRRANDLVRIHRGHGRDDSTTRSLH